MTKRSQLDLDNNVVHKKVIIMNDKKVTIMNDMSFITGAPKTLPTSSTVLN